MARPSRSDVQAITASASVVDLTKAMEVRRQKAARRDWQDESHDHYRAMPEIRYPANFIAGNLSRFRFRVGLLDADDLTAPAKVPTPSKAPDFYKQAADVLDELSGPQGGLPELANLYGINMAVAGDGWLYGQDIKEGGKRVGTEWEFLSIKELILGSEGATGSETAVYRDRDGSGEPTREENRLKGRGHYWRRFWKPHPTHSALADSPMEALGSDCRRLTLLNESIESRLLSRLASNGIFFVPNSITMPVVPTDTQVDPEDKVEDVVIRRIIAYMEAAIRNRGSAASAMPIFMRGPDEVGEKIRHIVLDSTISEQELKLRQEMRENIATGLDMPREASQGMESASHWTSWSVMDSTLRSHVSPMADRFAVGLLRVYLRPKLLRANVSTENLRLLTIIADGSGAAAAPNAAEDGRQLHDRIAISDKALRERSGVGEGDAPKDEDYVRQLGIQMKDPYLATFGLDVADKIKWEQVGKHRAEGAPGVGSTPTDRRKADPSDPAGAPGGRGGAGGVKKSAGK